MAINHHCDLICAKCFTRKSWNESTVPRLAEESGGSCCFALKESRRKWWVDSFDFWEAFLPPWSKTCRAEDGQQNSHKLYRSEQASTFLYLIAHEQSHSWKPKDKSVISGTRELLLMNQYCEIYGSDWVTAGPNHVNVTLPFLKHVSCIVGCLLM